MSQSKIPTRANPNTSTAKERPYSTFYTPMGKTGKVEQFDKTVGVKTELSETPKFALLSCTYYKYAMNDKTGLNYKSSEYFYKSDNVALFETRKGQAKGAKVFSGSVNLINDTMTGGEKVSTGAYMYVLEIETGKISRIQLNAGQNSIWFDFKKQSETEYPYFYLTMRESTKADKKAMEERYKRSVNVPDYILVFHQITTEQDDDAANNAANVIADYFGGVSTADSVGLDDENTAESNIIDHDKAF